MKIFCSCSKDAYITDKIVSDNRAELSNTGKAGTLDLFKLYNETLLRGTGSQHELSRILLKFDLSPVKKLLSTKVNLSSPDFSAKIKMFDLTSGHVKPTAYNVIAYPLAKKFDEGIGHDLSGFSDRDSCNFITASISTTGTKTIWHASGANALGNLGAGNIDAIRAANLQDGGGVQNVSGTQRFFTGDENLSIDVTRAISGTLQGLIPDHGFRVSFGEEENLDKKTRFVKRFASRHVLNPHLRPILEVSFNDSELDDAENFYFDTTGSIFLRNEKAGSFVNLYSGSQSRPVIGHNCMNIKIKAGKYSRTFKASQHSGGSGTNFFAGIYTASFAIPGAVDAEFRGNRTLQMEIIDKGFLDFTTYWTSLDGSQVYHTGSLRIKKTNISSLGSSLNVQMQTINKNIQHNISEVRRVRVFASNQSENFMAASKLPRSKKSLIFDRAYYRVMDADTKKIVIDFGEDDKSTLLSRDSAGHFFDFDFSILPIGRSYVFVYKVISGQDTTIIEDPASRFLVVNK